MKFERSRSNDRRIRGGRAAARVAAAVLSIVAMLAGATFLSAPAQAAEVDAIDSTSIVLTNVTYPGSPLRVREVAQIDFNWSLEGLNAVAGDTFSIELPKTFQVTSETIDLKVAGGTDSAGTCTLTGITSAAGPTLVCVLSDYVETHDNVKGSLWLRADAVAQTTETTVTVVVGGKSVVVALPGNGPIGPQNFGPVPTTPSKDGYWFSADRSAIKWVVTVPGAFAGQTNPLVFEDSFADGLALVTSGPNAPILMSIEATQAAWDAQNWAAVPSAQWQLVPQDAHSFTVTLQQPIQQDRIYRLSYVTTLDYRENLVFGDVFDNTVTMNGVTLKKTVEYTQVGGGSAQGDGRGGFVVAKQALAGDGATEVPSNTSYRVTATITEPGLPARDANIDIEAGGVPQGISDLPKGTLVHLEEVAPLDTSAYTWGSPKFSSTTNPNVVISPDASAVDFTVVADGTFRFALVNTVTKKALPDSFAIGDYTWIDANSDGLQSKGEKVLPGVTVTLADANGDPVTDLSGAQVASILTDANGFYHFDNLPAGDYTVRFEAPNGYEFTSEAAGSDRKIDSNANQSTGWTTAFTLGVDQGNTTPAEPSDGVTAQYIDRTIDAGFIVKKADVNGWVQIVKDDGREVVKPGELLNYSLVVTNKSPYTAKQVRVRDVLPANVDLISTSIVGVVSVDNPLALEWDLGDMAAGASRTIVVKVRVHAGLPGDTNIVNTATVTTEDTCVDRPETPENECKSTDTDRTVAGVWITKTDNTETVKPGEQLTYDITVGNSSQKTAVENASASDALPNNVTFVSATGGGQYDASAHRVAWSGINLAPGESRVVQVTVRVNAAAAGTVVNTAAVKAAECEEGDNTEACSSTDTTRVSAAALPTTGSSDGLATLLPAAFLVLLGGVTLTLTRLRRRQLGNTHS